ncbi:cation:dicarboxylate symporter family transporter [Pseudomonas sp. LB-090624]|uniref:cation:dicarboxylate symporter family transporter n=1 Tax=Pseudomonas sp. LB-090624 TaxID=2213079 RepID=UPI001304D8FD|nr:cation:dicarboxylase symporter family transporter [Pseudomonas sp. LB-090624]
MGIQLRLAADVRLHSLHATAVPLPAAGGHQGVAGLILGIVPDNIIDSKAKGNLMPVLFFAVMFSLGLSGLPSERKDPVLALSSASSTAVMPQLMAKLEKFGAPSLVARASMVSAWC